MKLPKTLDRSCLGIWSDDSIELIQVMHRGANCFDKTGNGSVLKLLRSWAWIAATINGGRTSPRWRFSCSFQIPWSRGRYIGRATQPILSAGLKAACRIKFGNVMLYMVKWQILKPDNFKYIECFTMKTNEAHLT